MGHQVRVSRSEVERLVRAYQRRPDERILDDILSGIDPLIGFIAIKNAVPGEEREDVEQRLRLWALDAVREWDGRTTRFGYFLWCLLHRRLGAWHRDRRQYVLPESLEDLVGNREPRMGAFENEVAARLLWDAIFDEAGLTPLQEAAILFTAQGWKQGEAGEELRTTTNAVRWATASARRRVRSACWRLGAYRHLMDEEPKERRAYQWSGKYIGKFRKGAEIGI